MLLSALLALDFVVEGFFDFLCREFLTRERPSAFPAAPWEGWGLPEGRGLLEGWGLLEGPSLLEAFTGWLVAVGCGGVSLPLPSLSSVELWYPVADISGIMAYLNKGRSN